MTAKLTDVSTKLAAALLLREGEISITDIKALPFVDNEDAVVMVVRALSRSFDLDTVQRPFASHTGWEDVLTLKRASVG